MFLWRKETDPRIAYNHWAAHYDGQPDNLMLALEAEIFSNLTESLSLKEKVVADIGCGTGRHWKELLSRSPLRLIGYDVSEGMLQQLKQRYPAAETYLIKDNRLHRLEERSCDIIISTLTLAHIRKIGSAFGEWNRVLKDGGEVLITDYHPAALARGADRTFRYQDKLIAVKNYIHPVKEIEERAKGLGWGIKSFTERVVDERVKHYYEKQQAMPVFERFHGVPITYGMYLRKKDAPA